MDPRLLSVTPAEKGSHPPFARVGREEGPGFVLVTKKEERGVKVGRKSEHFPRSSVRPSLTSGTGKIGDRWTGVRYRVPEVKGGYGTRVDVLV